MNKRVRRSSPAFVRRSRTQEHRTSSLKPLWEETERNGKNLIGWYSTDSHAILTKNFTPSSASGGDPIRETLIILGKNKPTKIWKRRIDAMITQMEAAQ